MKKPENASDDKFDHLIHLVPRIIILTIMILFFSGFQVRAQEEFPIVKIRLANPSYDCKTKLYCLDVEFQSNTAEQQVFGVNLRFFYDDDVLEYWSMGEFAKGYASLVAPDL